MLNCRALISIVFFASLSYGCSKDVSGSADGEKQSAVLTASTLGEQTVQSAAEYLQAAPYVSADISNGGRQAQICKACHSLQEGGANMIGPALFGMFGQAAGKNAGFSYSSALKEADFVWTPRALDAWLAQPAQFLPGNRMAFAGVSKKSDRNDLIAYLLRETKDDGS